MKNPLRIHYLSLISNLGFFDLIAKSSALSDRFFQWVSDDQALFKNRYLVSFYPFDGEPQINIERESRDEPYRVSYVRIDDWKKREMTAREARRDTPDLWEEFDITGGNRIFQPKASQKRCKEEEIAAILVPGAAFTRRGDRLGRGAGFYDRFLAAHPHALRIGIAFEEQVAPSLPVDEWDKSVDIVLTDQKLHVTKAFGEWRSHGMIKDRNKA